MKTNTTKISLMFVLLSVVFIAEAAQVIILPVLPSISHELFLHPDKSQYLLVVFFVGSIIGTLILGNLANLLGVHKVLCLSLLTLLIGNIIFCIGFKALHLLVARFLVGIGCGGALSLIGAVVISTFNNNTHMRIFGLLSSIINTERFFAICYIIMIISSVTSPIFSSHILELFGWRASLWVLTVINTIMLAYLLLGDAKKQIKKPESLGAIIVLKKLKALLAMPYFWLLTISRSLLIVAQILYVAMSPVLFIQIFGLSPQKFAYFLLVPSISALLGSLVVAKTKSNKQNKLCKFFALLALFASVINILIAITWEDSYVATLCMIVVPFFCCGAITPMLKSIALNQVKQHSNAASSIVQLCETIAGVLATFIAVLIPEHNNIPVSIGFGGGIIISIIIWWLVTNKHKGSWLINR
ncbi:MAG: MFS transporter [Legionellaceae bacterium]|nr:MFS transporter [Legionellaceae bacterium]